MGVAAPTTTPPLSVPARRGHNRLCRYQPVQQQASPPPYRCRAACNLCFNRRHIHGRLFCHSRHYSRLCAAILTAALPPPPVTPFDRCHRHPPTATTTTLLRTPPPFSLSHHRYSSAATAAALPLPPPPSSRRRQRHLPAATTVGSDRVPLADCLLCGCATHAAKGGRQDLSHGTGGPGTRVRACGL